MFLPTTELTIEFSIGYVNVTIDRLIKHRFSADKGLPVFNELERIGIPIAKNIRNLKINITNDELMLCTSEYYVY